MVSAMLAEKAIECSQTGGDIQDEESLDSSAKNSCEHLLDRATLDCDGEKVGSRSVKPGKAVGQRTGNFAVLEAGAGLYSRSNPWESKTAVNLIEINKGELTWRISH